MKKIEDAKLKLQRKSLKAQGTKGVVKFEKERQHAE